MVPQSVGGKMPDDDRRFVCAYMFIYGVVGHQYEPWVLLIHQHQPFQYSRYPGQRFYVDHFYLLNHTNPLGNNIVSISNVCIFIQLVSLPLSKDRSSSHFFFQGQHSTTRRQSVKKGDLVFCGTTCLYVECAESRRGIRHDGQQAAGS